MTWNVINPGNKFVETTIEPTQAWKNTRTIDKKDKKNILIMKDKKYLNNILDEGMDGQTDQHADV